MDTRTGIVRETPRFVGRAIAHLAGDPELARWNGQTLSSGQLAKVYGFTDVDGSRPDCWRYMDEVQEAGKPADATATDEKEATMRQIVTLLMIVAVTSTTSLGQVHKSTERAIVALEKRAFDAWIKKDRKFFEQNMWSEGQYLAADGVGAKVQYIKAIIENNCTVTRYALDNTKVTMLSRDSALLTYQYTHDAVCGGNPEASPIWASTIYVKRNAKWLIAFHQEVPAQSK